MTPTNPCASADNLMPSVEVTEPHATVMAKLGVLGADGYRNPSAGVSRSVSRHRFASSNLTANPDRLRYVGSDEADVQSPFTSRYRCRSHTDFPVTRRGTGCAECERLKRGDDVD